MLKIIQELLQEPIQKREELLLAKRKIAKKYKLQFFENSEILKGYHALLKKKAIVKMPDLERILRRRSIRTLSGIASVSVLTKPFGCPNNCAYCPTEIRVPKSYLSNEPAVMRAIRFKYDAYNQVQGRIKSLVDNGHAPTKIELIVIGGTWSSLPEKYKYWYILECFQGANNFKKNQITPNKSKLNEKSSLEILKQALLKEQRRNEKAKYRIIGLTLETRPDWINEKELAQMRMMGCTRVEIGVQLTDDAVLSKNNRGHGVAEIVLATKMLRDWGFKITYHWMPGLPGSNPALDIQKFKELFTNENFQPDQIKFYPTIVVKNSLLYTWWKQGKYIPYTSQELEHIITECKQVVPPYVRIIRLIRDIPGNSIIAGNKITNLRQILQQKGVHCLCIRCREPKEIHTYSTANPAKPLDEEYQLKAISYKANFGIEHFISFESANNILLGFCRLRIPDLKSTRTPSYLKNSAFIRELHVYGELSPLASQKNIQHKGIGKKLMLEAEKIIQANNLKKIIVISGVGVRGYYRKLGYRLYHTYMVKRLN